MHVALGRVRCFLAECGNFDKRRMADKDYMTTSPQQFLTIDQGTQSIRAIVFDAYGEIVDKDQIKIESYFSEKAGWAEQHPDYFWKQLGDVCQLLWRQGKVSADNIHAIAVTTQRGTMINLDAQGQPLRPAVVWLDQRLCTSFKPLPWYWKVAFRLIGQTEAIHYFQQKAPANWIAQHQPDIWNKTDKYLLLSGYLTYKLTGHYRDSAGSVVGYVPFNYRKHQWANRFDWKWHVVPVKKSQLPDIVRPGDTLGNITPEAALLTGLTVGIPVIASASDKACEVLGSGGINPNTACVSFGTTATVNCNVDHYVEPLSFIPPFPSAIPGYFNTEVMIFRGFWMVNWFKEHFGLPEVQEAELQDMEAETLFNKLISAVPAGSDGLLLQPYWSPGLKNLEARGAMIGFSDHHTRAHFYRAMLEGLIYALREGTELLSRRLKVDITRVVVSGGGSQSDEVMQITADIFNMTIERPHTYETSGLGAAIQLAVSLGTYPDYPTAVHHMSRTGKVFHPIAKNAQEYEWIFKQLYRPLYNRLKPLYRKLFLKDSIGDTPR